jgi:hypothetical protein
MPDNPLHLLLHPRSVATAGAGNNPMKMGTLQALSLIKDGYQGKFYPIHPPTRLSSATKPTLRRWTSPKPRISR